MYVLLYVLCCCMYCAAVCTVLLYVLCCCMYVLLYVLCCCMYCAAVCTVPLYVSSIYFILLLASQYAQQALDLDDSVWQAHQW